MTRLRVAKLLIAGVVATLMAATQLPASPPALAGNDDYPTYLKSATMDQITDPWGWPNRECTSFAAWRQNRDGHPMTDGMAGGWFGSAGNWKQNASNIGLPFLTTPVAGAVGWFNYSQSSPDGHVSYVEYIGPPVTIEDYNWGIPHGFYHEHQATPDGYIVFGTPAPGYSWSILNNHMLPEVFGINTGGGAYHAWLNADNTWSIWNLLPAPAGVHFFPGLTVAEATDGRMEAFAIGWDGMMYSTWQNTINGGWTTWSAMPGSFSGQFGSQYVAAARNLNGQLQVFAVGATGDILTSWQQCAVGCGYGGFQTLISGHPEPVSSVPAVTQELDGRLALFIITADNRVDEFYEIGRNQPSSWQQYSLGTYAIGERVAVVRDGIARVSVFVASGDYALWTRWMNSHDNVTDWAPWYSLGAPAGGQVWDPAAGLIATWWNSGNVGHEGQIEVWGSAADYSSASIWQVCAACSYGSWSNFFAGQSVRVQDALIQWDGSIALFAYDANDSGISVDRESSPQGGWGGWLNLGGSFWSP